MSPLLQPSMRLSAFSSKPSTAPIFTARSGRRASCRTLSRSSHAALALCSAQVSSRRRTAVPAGRPFSRRQYHSCRGGDAHLLLRFRPLERDSSSRMPIPRALFECPIAEVLPLSATSLSTHPLEISSDTGNPRIAKVFARAAPLILRLSSRWWRCRPC